MGSAPAIEALAGLTFNRVAFAADMAMFDFGPTRPKIVGYGPRKGTTVFVGTHGLHVQCPWQLRHGTVVIASSDGPLVPDVVDPAAGVIVSSAEMSGGVILLSLGDFQLEVSPDDSDAEDWRLLTDEPEDDDLVWGGEFGTEG